MTGVRLCWLLVLVCAVGCANEEQGGVVIGKVIYQGKALTKGTVAFQPSEGEGQLCHGNIQDDGTFKLKNQLHGERVPFNEYIATVLVDNATVAVMQENPLLVPKPEIPLKFSSVTNSPLRFKVESEANNIQIDLDNEEVAKKE